MQSGAYFQFFGFSCSRLPATGIVRRKTLNATAGIYSASATDGICGRTASRVLARHKGSGIRRLHTRSVCLIGKVNICICRKILPQVAFGHGGGPIEKRLSHSRALTDRGDVQPGDAALEDVLNMEKVVRMNSDDESYKRFVEASETRLCELCVQGLLSPFDLCQLVKGCDQAILFLGIGCAVRLFKTDFIHINWMADFLTSVSYHPLRRLADCHRLQLFVDFLADNVAEATVGPLLKALRDVCFIDELNAHCLMTSIEQCYRNSLLDFQAAELAWLAEASCLIFSKCNHDHTDFFKTFLEVVSLRFSSFTPQQCVAILKALVYIPVECSRFHCSALKKFQAFEEHLAVHIDILTEKELSWLCTVFHTFGYKANHISFKNILSRRIGKMQSKVLIHFLHYILHFDAIEEDLLERLFYRIQPVIGCCNVTEISLVLSSLCKIRVSKRAYVRALARICCDEIVERLSVAPKSFNPAVAAHIFYSTTLLKMCSPLVGEQLFQAAISEFSGLPFRVKARFLYATSSFSDYPHLVTAVHNMLCVSDGTDFKVLTHNEAVLFCYAFFKMRLASESWLMPIAEYCLQDFDALVADHCKELAAILFCLSMLNFLHQRLLSRVAHWLDNTQCHTLFVHRGSELINILWACVVQGVFPKKTLQQLARITSSWCYAHKLPRQRWKSLLQINLAWYECFESNLLSREMRSAAWAIIRSDHLPQPYAVEQCISKVIHLLPPGCVCSGCFMLGMKVSCLLLKDRDGQLVKWHNRRKAPSVKDIMTWHQSGLKVVAVLILPPKWFLFQSTFPVRPVRLWERALKRRKIQVLILRTTHQEDPEKQMEYFRTMFACVGITLSDQTATL